MVIQETTDYSIFKLDKFNLTVHGISMGAKKCMVLTQMVKSMKEHGWKSYSVIEVDKYYNVLDGNMRLLAAMEAGVPVRFVINEKVKSVFDYHRNYNTHLKNKHKYNRLSK